MGRRRHGSIAWGLAGAGVLGAAVGCSLSALDGFAGTPAPDPGGGDGASGRDGETPTPTPIDDGNGDGGPSPSPSSDGGCVAPFDTADAICATFDVGALTRGWNLVTGSGTSATGTGSSPPNAAAFVLPNPGGGASTGHHLTKTFAGGWSAVRCTFVAALDEIPSNGGVDIATVTSAGSTSDDVGLRVYASNFELISCRNGSDCLSQVNAGGLPRFGEFHRYRLEWTAAVGYAFALDDQPRGSITTKTPLASPANATVAFGTIYRPYGTGGAFRIRHDDVVCVRTP